MSEVITFNLEKQEAEFILTAVAQLPYVQSAGLIAKLQQQAQESIANQPPQEIEESPKLKEK